MTYIILLISILILALVIYLIFSSKAAGSEEFSKKLEEALEKAQERNLEEFSRNRSEYSASARDLRQELTATLTKLSENNALHQKNQLDSFALTLKNISEAQLKNLESLNDSLKKLNDSTKETLKNEIRFLQEKNDKKLEEMRQTVDEKLQSTLEKRLGESFNLVSGQLEKVHQGLGDMRRLANEVGNLEMVLTNVKNRGGFGEVVLKSILDDFLTNEQYDEQAEIPPGSGKRVDFAVKFPSKITERGFIFLPIDSKFPKDDYERLLKARENGNTEEMKNFKKNLETSVLKQAKDIKEKYINVPATTNFALMFLPSEGLYSQILSSPGLFEKVYREHKVVITGPATITAILSSLRFGFQTIAIEKKTAEIWDVLGAVKNEFEKFAQLLSKTHKQIDTVARTIEDAERKTRTIGRKLLKVEKVDDERSRELLELSIEEELESEEAPTEEDSSHQA
ncbi:MAG: DNA recombination protein RmuC [Elusimicrobiota bacterium]